MSVEIFSKIVSNPGGRRKMNCWGKARGSLQGRPQLEKLLPYVGAETQRAGNCSSDNDSTDLRTGKKESTNMEGKTGKFPISAKGK